MFITRTDYYDRGVNTFSAEGRLFQVEAIKLGSTGIGLKTKEGVVVLVEKSITSPCCLVSFKTTSSFTSCF